MTSPMASAAVHHAWLLTMRPAARAFARAWRVPGRTQRDLLARVLPPGQAGPQEREGERKQRMAEANHLQQLTHALQHENFCRSSTILQDQFDVGADRSDAPSTSAVSGSS